MKSYADVQMYFTNRMSGIIAQKGRRMMGWNEIYGHDVNGDGGGKAGARLDTNAVIQFWKGNTGLAKNAIRDGHDVINSLHTSTYLDYSYGSIPLQKAYGFEPVFPDWRNSTIPESRGWALRYGQNGFPHRNVCITRRSPASAPLRRSAGHPPAKRTFQTSRNA